MVLIVINGPLRLSLLTRFRHHLVLSVLIGSLAVSGGCSRPDQSEQAGPGMRSDDAKPRVFTTFTVLADLARQVAGDRLSVDSIV